MVSEELKRAPDNQYLQDEVLLDRVIVQRVLAVPVHVAQRALRKAAGLPPIGVPPFLGPSSEPSTFSPLLGVAGAPVAVMDLGATSPLYKSGNWMDLSVVADIVESASALASGGAERAGKGCSEDLLSNLVLS